MSNHVIMTGRDGRLQGTSPEQVATICSDALQRKRLVLHFHGGLVNEASGLRIAENLTETYLEAGAYPIFFVWHAGAFEIIRNNFMEILREDLFEQILKRILRWSAGKVSQAGEGARGPLRLPDEATIEDHLALRALAIDAGHGQEPFRSVAPSGRVPDLTRAEEQRFLAEVETNPGLEQALVGAVVARTGLPPTGQRGRRNVKANPSLIDDEVLAASMKPAAGRAGLVTTVAIAKKALEVLRDVISRYRSGTDSGLYCTVVDEICRSFYVSAIGSAGWFAMKKETEDAFADEDRGARMVLTRLAAQNGEPSRPSVTLVGHSTGAVFIDNLLRNVVKQDADGSRAWAADWRFQVALLAPAATTRHFAETLDVAQERVGRLRVFTMKPETETQDHVLGAAYPRSLLYLVSGLLERDGDGNSALQPLLGMARYLAADADSYRKSDAGRIARLPDVHAYMTAEPGRVVLSVDTTADLGLRASAVTHGSFDDDADVRQSLQHMIRTWHG